MGWMDSQQAFVYDSAGRLEQVHYSRGHLLSFTVSYRYDGAGRLIGQEVQDGNQRITPHLEYADHQSVGSVWWQTTKVNGRELANFTYTDDPDGTVRTVVEHLKGAPWQSREWDDYADGSLKYEKRGVQPPYLDPYPYPYDSGGNMGTGVPAAPNAEAQDAYNQLRAIGSWTFSYNTNGERIGESNSPTGNREYQYDGFGNLVAVWQGGRQLYGAEYDALGRRVKYWTPLVGERYLLYDGDTFYMMGTLWWRSGMVRVGWWRNMWGGCWVLWHG